MADTEMLDALLKTSVNGNGTTGLFYKPIKPTGDLITAKSLRGRRGKRVSELHIAPPSVKLGTLPTRILNELDELLALAKAPGADEVVRLEIEEILAANGGGSGSGKNVLLAALERKGRSGAVNASARRLNESKLDPVERAMLSRFNIAMYVFYRAIVGMKVKDVDGIITNALSSLDKVRSYVNRALVKEVLTRKNLQADTGEVKALQKRLASRNLSYEGNFATQTILEEYEYVKGNVDLIAAVNKFLDTGLVAVPEGVNRDLLVRKMISYLSENGFNPRAILGLDASFRVAVNGLEARFTDTSIDDGRVTSWLWDFGDGNTSNAQNPTHTYAGPESYTVTLTVTDNEGNQESAIRTVSIAAEASTPKAAIEFSTSNLKVDFKAKYADGGKPVQWAWDFGDGQSSTKETPIHTYAKPASYNVSVKVTDDNGASASAQKKIRVYRSGGAEVETPPTGLKSDKPGPTTGATV